ncbi:hypothetical protein [Serratia marcescens]|uniref:hypothetical protein n=1 Tax=Serratia marcescens TaxID=615 RepID=UPI0013DAB5E5|nr:hypothetical protein [Serratia marcescens]
MNKNYAGQSSTSDGYTSGEMRSDYINEKVRLYGFIECGDILQFIQVFCPGELGVGELMYVLGKLKECLGNHDNQTPYFSGLRKLSREINDELIYRISIQQ